MKRFFIITAILSTVVTSSSADFFSSMFHDMREAAKDMKNSARDTMHSVRDEDDKEIEGVSEDRTESVSKNGKKSVKDVTDDERIEKSK